ncbi:MAG: hypothetical protein J3Q66DRAFT_172115 [Benniella sp.]|nr:MAG: hypothetical protein J3Q66DRAFT_172115 [Benniella sp.]
MDSYTPPVKVTFMACMSPVAEGYNGDRRYYVRISLHSALNIPWDKGWSAVVTMCTNKKCPHRNNSESGRHNEVIAGLADLSPHTPWTRDFDIDLQTLDLPLTITLGLQLNEEHKSTDNPVSAYFYVESFDLDAIHFAEPVRDRSKHFTSFPVYASARPQALGGSGETGGSLDSIHRIYRPLNEDGNECQECVRELSETILHPIAFVIDTQEIQVAQCLPALLGEGVPSDRMMALVQSSFRGCLFLPEECLPKTTGIAVSTSSGLPWQKSPGLALASQPDIGKVWVTMETKDNTGSTNSIISATVSVKGLDSNRTRIVYRALERRVAELFEQ